jgi:hypothetical protein
VSPLKGTEVKLDFCAACGAKEDVEHHHLVMRIDGGSNHSSNLITLCCACHYKMHERKHDGTYNHSRRVIAGQQAARAAGVRMGRKPKLSPHQRAEATCGAVLPARDWPILPRAMPSTSA